MKAKAKIKIIVDILMTAGLLFLMGFQFWGGMWHMSGLEQLCCFSL